MFNTGILGQAKSYISTGTGLLKNPRHILGFTNSSFLKSLSDTTLERMKGRSDPALSCFWDVSLPDVETYTEQKNSLLQAADTLGAASFIVSGGGLLGGAFGTVGNGLQTASDKLASAGSWVNDKLGNPTSKVKLDSEYVEAVSLPFREYSSKEVFRGGVMRKYPDATATLGDLTLTFYVGNDNESFRYIMNWMNLIATPASQDIPDAMCIWNPPKLYKKTISFVLMDMNSNDVYSIDYLGCWPKSMSDVSLDAGGERLTYDVTFSTDNMYAYGFDYIPFTDELKNIATGAMSAAMGKATEFVTSRLAVKPGSMGNSELF